MGVGPYIAERLARMVPEHSLSGPVLTLGRMEIPISEDHLRKCAEISGASAQPAVAAVHQHGRAFRENGNPSDDLFFATLGFDRVDSVDVSAYENATYTHDLNELYLCDTVGDNRYSLIVDGGTIEHVFHLPNVFANIFGVLEVGGCVLHAAPSNNHCDHGFYQLSPTFFYDWYSANGWAIKESWFFRYTKDAAGDPHTVPWVFTPYKPMSLDSVAFGGLDGALYGTLFLAQKTEDSTWSVIPQQRQSTITA